MKYIIVKTVYWLYLHFEGATPGNLCFFPDSILDQLATRTRESQWAGYAYLYSMFSEV